MAERTRLVVSKQFGANAVKIGEGVDAASIPVNGIPGLAAYGFVALVNAQAQDGPRTLEYYIETARLLAVSLASGWKPGDSSGIMKKKFQLSRALWNISGEKARRQKRDPQPFETFVARVNALTDAERSVASSMPQFATVIAGFNSPKSEAVVNDDMQRKLNALTA